MPILSALLLQIGPVLPPDPRLRAARDCPAPGPGDH